MNAADIPPQPAQAPPPALPEAEAGSIGSSAAVATKQNVELAKTVVQLRRLMQVARQKTKEQGEQLRASRDAFENLELANCEQQREVVSRQKEAADLRSALAEAQREKEALRASLEVALREREKHRQDLDALSKLHAATQREMVELRARVDAAQQEIAALSASNEDLATKHADVSNDLFAACQEVEKMLVEFHALTRAQAEVAQESEAIAAAAKKRRVDKL